MPLVNGKKLQQRRPRTAKGNGQKGPLGLRHVQGGTPAVQGDASAMPMGAPRTQNQPQSEAPEAPADGN